VAANIYYQDELQYLREVGPEFAATNPEIARFLADRGSDPDVERILEGVAFLCGRIREKLDDELPELTANMMALLWPHYLHPVPSMTILEFLPEVDAMQGPLTVKAGAEFLSVPVDGTRCRYRSCWPTVLRPWTLRDVRLDTAAARPVRLVMLLQTAPRVTLERLSLDAVRLHLAGDPRTAFVLYLLLAAHVEEVTVSDGSSRDGRDRAEIVLGPEHVVPAGLTRQEGVLPYPARSFAGYRLLQEYFAFKERFLFLDLKGLNRAVAELALTDTIQVAITFNRRMESLPMASRDNVRLHCVPVINLFEQPADPIRLRHDRTEYLVQPSKTGVADRRHLEVFSVDQVTGLVPRDTEPRAYAPFYSFQHAAGRDRRSGAYYQTHVRRNVLGGDPRFGTDTWVSLVAGTDLRDVPEEETISIELTCTNRNLPESLRAGDIVEPTDSSPPNARFRNIVKPTATICPPLGKSLHWRLISHMSLNYVSLADVDHFKELLRVYDFQAEHDAQQAIAHQRMVDGILSLRTGFDERMVRGAPLRGSQIEIELNEDHFAGEGDAYLFTTILDRFMGLYATLNAYTQLTVRFARSGQRYVFPARWGEQLTPADSRKEGPHD
jgi:type VI secretion system protein ImpG